MRNSHDCNDNVNFVCLTWFWSFPSGRCGQRTWKGNCCVFPFVYRGRRYNSCTRRGSKRFWCPIVPGYKPGQAWGYCRGKQGEIIFVIRFSPNKMSSPSTNLLILVHRGLASTKISREECFIRYSNDENRPFAANDHVVQNPLCWRAISLLFWPWDIKNNVSQASLVQVSLF